MFLTGGRVSLDVSKYIVWESRLPTVGSFVEILVGGLEHFLFSHMLGIIIPIDSYFSEG